ncbi:unnamed protein product, partial [Heterotrigona itama]
FKGQIETEQIINSLLVNNFYPTISKYRRVNQKESDESLWTVFGLSLWSVHQLPAQR